MTSINVIVGSIIFFAFFKSCWFAIKPLKTNYYQ